MIQRGTHLGALVVVDLILGAGVTAVVVVGAEVTVGVEAGGCYYYFFSLSNFGIFLEVFLHLDIGTIIQQVTKSQIFTPLTCEIRIKV